MARELKLLRSEALLYMEGIAAPGNMVFDTQGLDFFRGPRERKRKYDTPAVKAPVACATTSAEADAVDGLNMLRNSPPRQCTSPPRKRHSPTSALASGIETINVSDDDSTGSHSDHWDSDDDDGGRQVPRYNTLTRDSATHYQLGTASAKPAVKYYGESELDDETAAKRLRNRMYYAMADMKLPMYNEFIKAVEKLCAERKTTWIYMRGAQKRVHLPRLGRADLETLIRMSAQYK